MMKKMRRKDKEVFDNEIEVILNKGEYGMLSTISEDGYPYTTPLNYVYSDNSIYFHCAKDGHKIQNIENNNKVSFCVVTDTEVIKDKFNTRYESVVAFGTASIIEDDEKERVMIKFVEKYSPEFMESGKSYIERAISNIHVIKLNIEHMTGKAKY